MPLMCFLVIMSVLSSDFRELRNAFIGLTFIVLSFDLIWQSARIYSNRFRLHSKRQFGRYCYIPKWDGQGALDTNVKGSFLVLC